MVLKSLLDPQQPLHFLPALPSIAVSLKSCNMCHSEILELLCFKVLQEKNKLLLGQSMFQKQEHADMNRFVDSNCADHSMNAVRGPM